MEYISGEPFFLKKERFSVPFQRKTFIHKIDGCNEWVIFVQSNYSRKIPI